MSYRSAPLSRNPADLTDYEVPLTVANSAPSGTTVVHATYAPQDGSEVSKVRRAPRVIAITATFTGTDATNATWVCRYWSYNPDTSRWTPSENFTLVGDTNITATLARQKNIDHDPNARYGYIEVVSGVAANQVLEATIIARKW